MSAKEMFEQLGYEIDINCLGIVRYSRDDNDGMKYCIRFYNDLKEFDCNTVIDNKLDCLTIDIPLLQAINKQIEELGWNNG